MGTTDGGKTPGKQPSQQSPKGLIYYFLTIFLVTMLLNALVFPNVMEEKVMEVNYNEFLAMVDAGKVVQVEKDTDQIMFLATDAQGKEQIYKTGLWEDEALTNRLYKAGVTFGKVIPHKESALMNFPDHLDPALWTHVLNGPFAQPDDGQAHGWERHDLWKVQRQDLCGK